MKKDYEYVIRVIRNKDNKLIHYPAIKNLIDLWVNKWSGSKKYTKNIFNVYLHSLNTNIKREFR
jgi:hypothetical protein